MNKTKYQLTVEWSQKRIELLKFGNSVKQKEAFDNLNRMQTVVRVAYGDKRKEWAAQP